MDSLDKQETNTQSTSMHITESRVYAQVVCCTKQAELKVGDKLALMFKKPHQYYLEDGENVPADESENIDLRDAFVEITLADAAINSRNTVLVNDCFKIVRTMNSVTAIAKKSVGVTDKILILSVCQKNHFTNRTQLECQGMEKSDKTYISVPCQAICEPLFWKIKYHLNNGEIVQRVSTDKRKVKEALDVYKSDILTLVDHASLQRIPTKNITGIEIDGSVEDLYD